MGDPLIVSLFTEDDQEFHEWSRVRPLADQERLLLTKYLVKKDKRVIEAGTGGGSIALFLENMGFEEIHAFDLSPRMIEAARINASRTRSKISFDIADAANLHQYQSGYFDYLVYMQQVLCCVPKEGFRQALTEAYRIAAPGSVSIFSFLNWESRMLNSLLSMAVNFSRRARNERSSSRYLPLLLRNRRLNWRYFSSHQPSFYWPRPQEAVEQIQSVGFRVIETTTEQVGTNGRTSQGTGLYVVASKTSG